ncbi:glycerophosphodiester phosphodiesterase family protein [Pantoea allii]|uniref:Glycerophosphodiester phosphodiesterase family protein n=1 Tax=Pantoea allii TaxID=574096 RepID=A0ABS6VE88_9GAMM|nr:MULTISPECIES: glycerophosphodiester phosphodiesterase [Pantoea]MBW1214353.1 glycerophosphodiester phosphodiesterase family protein [Pantoea allii]MBW1257635.1 glycerophosphodiester phosphodiesterase family protein [Pantoea allii]MBW1266646.1 glycerophosphodiester phosphodiesterase family protein [Pantoea allii]MBW1288771.1 glycerophosphodiester phosphodiesterase family protein [Pantoea allii]OAE09416.1 glycerophosphodiester phosphodiesterase [Pantoea sp. OXWO6B1]
MTRVVSHRGANHFAPENTFFSADLALEQGADYIELDVRESADGVLYVIHDETLDRTTNGTGLVGHALSRDIDTLDAGSWFDDRFKGAIVPRLDDYLEHLRGRAGVYIELKYCDPLKVAALVRDLGMVRDTFFFSFSDAMRTGLQAVAPEFRKMMTLDIAMSPSLVAPLHHGSIIEMNVEQMRNPGILESSRKAGLEIMVYYGGDDIKIHQEIASAGVDYINLNRPDIFSTIRR